MNYVIVVRGAEGKEPQGFTFIVGPEGTVAVVGTEPETLAEGADLQEPPKVYRLTEVGEAS